MLADHTIDIENTLYVPFRVSIEPGIPTVIPIDPPPGRAAMIDKFRVRDDTERAREVVTASLRWSNGNIAVTILCRPSDEAEWKSGVNCSPVVAAGERMELVLTCRSAAVVSGEIRGRFR